MIKRRVYRLFGFTLLFICCIPYYECTESVDMNVLEV